MLKEIILLLFVQQLFFIQNNAAQTDPRDSIINEVLEKTWINNFQLMGSRGLIDYPYNKAKFTSSDVLKTLRYWDDTKHKVGILIYLFDESDHLNISFLNNANKTDTITTSITKKQLAGLEIQLKASIGATIRKSSSYTRGVKLTDQSSKLNTDSLVTIISNILQPYNFPISSLDHLIISPSANIGAFPFAMLHINNQPLIDRMSYSIIPSINEFIIRSEIVNKNVYSISINEYRYRTDIRWKMEQSILIGNPGFSNFGTWNFKNLPGAEIEVNEISKGLKEKVLLIGK